MAIKSNIGLALMESSVNPLVERVATALSNAAKSMPPNFEKIEEILSALDLKDIYPEHLSGATATLDRYDNDKTVLFIWHKSSGNPVPELRSFSTRYGGRGSILPDVDKRISKMRMVDIVKMTDVPPPLAPEEEVLPDELPQGTSASGLEKKIADTVSVALRRSRGARRKKIFDKIDEILNLFGLPKTDRKSFKNISFGEPRNGQVAMFINSKRGGFPLQVSFDNLNSNDRGFYEVNGILMKPYAKYGKLGIYIPKAERLLRKIPKDKIEKILDDISVSKEQEIKKTVDFENVQGVGEAYGKLLSYMSLGLGLSPRPDIIEKTEKLIERLVREGTKTDYFYIPRILSIEPHALGVKFNFGRRAPSVKPGRYNAMGTSFDVEDGSIIIHDFETFFGTHRDFARGSNLMRQVIELGERLGVLEQ
jgi:hypothetical protein